MNALDSLLPPLDLVNKCLELSLFLLKTREINAVVHKVIKIAIHPVERWHSLVTLILGNCLNGTVDGTAGIVE